MLEKAYKDKKVTQEQLDQLENMLSDPYAKVTKPIIEKDKSDLKVLKDKKD